MTDESNISTNANEPNEELPSAKDAIESIINSPDDFDASNPYPPKPAKDIKTKCKKPLLLFVGGAADFMINENMKKVYEKYKNFELFHNDYQHIEYCSHTAWPTKAQYIINLYEKKFGGVICLVGHSWGDVLWCKSPLRCRKQGKELS
ncbi:hypothetical protein [Bartonella sp. LJL80]